MSVPSNQDPANWDPNRDPANRNPDPRYATPDPGYSSPATPYEQHAPVTDPGHMLPAHATENAPKRSWLRTVILVAVILLVAGIIVWRVHSNNVAAQEAADKAAAAASRPIPVQVSLVQQKTVPVYLTALGTVTAYNTVTINTRVSGQLLQVNFREGQAVKKGQVLLEIDPRPYQAALDQAVGTLAKDQANLKDMEAEAQRYTALYEAGVVSKEQQQLEVSNAGQAQGTIKADQAAVETAKVNLGYTRIVSPIDGVVGLRQVDPGNIVNSGQSTGLVVITQIHPIAIVFTLPEDQLPQVQQAMKGGQKLVVEAYDRSDAHKIGAGTLLTIDNQIDTTTGTAKLKAVFENTDGSLFPNQFVNVRLVLRDRPNAIVIPTAAIQSGTQGSFVFVVNPGPTPENKKPKIASTDGSGKSKGAAAKTAGTADESGGEAASGSGGKGAGKGGGQRAPSCPAAHADMVAVRVDLTIGTNTVVGDGELQAGQQVIVDGAEKLVDGGNVCQQLAKGNPPAPQTGIGAGATGSTPSTGSSSTSSTPDSNAGTGQNSGQAGQSGGTH